MTYSANSFRRVEWIDYWTANWVIFFFCPWVKLLAEHHRKCDFSHDRTKRINYVRRLLLQFLLESVAMINNKNGKWKINILTAINAKREVCYKKLRNAHCWVDLHHCCFQQEKKSKVLQNRKIDFRKTFREWISH